MINELLEKDYIIIKNENIPENEYTDIIYNRFKNNEFRFQKINKLKDDYVINYHKIFLDNWSFQAVKPCKNVVTAYVNYIKSHKNFYIDKINKVLLILKYKS